MDRVIQDLPVWWRVRRRKDRWRSAGILSAERFQSSLPWLLYMFYFYIGKCPHYKDLSVIIEAIDHADVLILSSPVYVYHATGAMMDFLDHFGTWWVVHRIEKICVGVQATKLDEIPAAIRKQIEKKTDRVAERIVSHAGSIGTNHRFQMWFNIVKLMHSLMPGDTPDYHWWENHGWHGDQRPWKSEI